MPTNAHDNFTEDKTVCHSIPFLCFQNKFHKKNSRGSIETKWIRGFFCSNLEEYHEKTTSLDPVGHDYGPFDFADNLHGSRFR